MLTLLTFFGSLLFLYLIRNFGRFINITQPQREITPLSQDKQKHKPVPCGGILFMSVFSVYCYFFEKIVLRTKIFFYRN